GGQPDEQGSERARDADGDLEEPVDADRIAEVRGAPAQENASETESRHEGGQHGGDCMHRVAEDEPQHPEPDDLVDERRRSGEEEAGKEDQGTSGFPFMPSTCNTPPMTGRRFHFWPPPVNLTESASAR